MMKKLMTKSLSVFLVLLFATVMTACGGPKNVPQDRTVIRFWPTANQYTAENVNQIINNYNEGQGIKDGVYVQVDLTKLDVSSNHFSVCPENVRNQTDILTVSDRYVFYGAGYASGSFYTDISALAANEELRTKDENGNYYLSFEDYASPIINRFYFNRETKEAGNPKSGSLYALPFAANPSVVIYNETYFENANINIISVKEEDLDSYNSKNGTSYAPRGYCEYTTAAAPAQGLKTSVNLSGETVIKVFNNLVPMNFIELNTLSKNFTKTYNSSSPSDYGFLNEWWFSHGWAVGGNCIAWDNDAEQHVFTLGDTTKAYMVTKTVTIDGTNYNPGDVLGYNARKYIEENLSQVDTTALYEIPSQYDQFKEFCALSQTTDKKVDFETYGYGISPHPSSFSNSSKVKYFTTGKVAMLVNDYGSLRTITGSTMAKINIAPLYAYRVFEGEGNYGADEFKVVGKEYGGKVFEGKLKVVNGTQIKREPLASDEIGGFAIPANSTKKEAAWKFLQYYCSKNIQMEASKAHNGVPTNTELALSDEYAKIGGKLVENYAAAGIMATNCQIGDWSYLGDKEWIDDWSADLNGPVRNGLMTLESFFEKWNPRVNGEIDYTKSLKLEKYFSVKWAGLK